jgi:hypothetical protein
MKTVNMTVRALIDAHGRRWISINNGPFEPTVDIMEKT